MCHYLTLKLAWDTTPHPSESYPNQLYRLRVNKTPHISPMFTLLILLKNHITSHYYFQPFSQTRHCTHLCCLPFLFNINIVFPAAILCVCVCTCHKSFITCGVLVCVVDVMLANKNFHLLNERLQLIFTSWNVTQHDDDDWRNYWRVVENIGLEKGRKQIKI